MTRTKPVDRARVRPAWVGGALWLGAALWGAGPCLAGDCGHCPPPYVHCTEQPPRIRFKGVCPKPVCPPCDEEFWGYYPTDWRRWPAPAPAGINPAARPAPPGPFPPVMPPADGPAAQPGNLGDLPGRSGRDEG